MCRHTENKVTTCAFVPLFIKIVEEQTNKFFNADPREKEYEGSDCDRYFLTKEDAKYVLETDWIPPSCQKSKPYFPSHDWMKGRFRAHDLLMFMVQSLDDSELGSFKNRYESCRPQDTKTPILWRNVNYYARYLKKIGLDPQPSKQVTILAEISEEVLEPYGVWGYSEFCLGRCINKCPFRVDYFIHLSKNLVIEIDEQHHKKQFREILNDQAKKKLEKTMDFRVINVDTAKWEDEDDTYRKETIESIKEHILTYDTDALHTNLNQFQKQMYHHLKKAVGKTALGQLLKDEDACSIPLKRVLKALGIKKGEDIYHKIRGAFGLEQIIPEQDEENLDLSGADSDDDSEEEYQESNDVQHPVPSPPKTKKDIDNFEEDEDFELDEEGEPLLSLATMYQVACLGNVNMARKVVASATKLFRFLRKRQKALLAQTLDFDQMLKRSKGYSSFEKYYTDH